MARNDSSVTAVRDQPRHVYCVNKFPTQSYALARGRNMSDLQIVRTADWGGNTKLKKDSRPRLS